MYLYKYIYKYLILNELSLLQNALYSIGKYLERRQTIQECNQIFIPSVSTQNCTILSGWDMCICGFKCKWDNIQLERINLLHFSCQKESDI